MLVGPAVITLVMTGQGLTLMVINVITTLVTVLLGIIITPRAGMQGLAAVVAGVIVTQHLAIWLAVRWRCGLWTHAAPGLAVRRLGGLLSGLKVRSHRA